MADNAYDFSGLTVSQAEMPKTGAGRPGKYGDKNPFSDPLAESFEAFEKDQPAGRSVSLPGKNAGEAVYLIRKAADALNIGARVIIQTQKGETITAKDAKALGNRQVKVLFSGKNRKQKREAEAEQGEQTDAEQE